MPEIHLKPNSAEYADEKTTVKPGQCEMPGCPLHGEHKAPKHRGLNEYYLFCFDHVREYNKAWNFFEGMNDSEVEQHTINAMYGDRPTWKYGVNGDPYEELYKKAWQTFNYSSEDPTQHKKQYDPSTGDFSQYSQEHKAMAVMGLEPPITLEGVKMKYKELAKKHHPDLNGGCAKSEELLKEINMAYTILKLAYEQYSVLKERR